MNASDILEAANSLREMEAIDFLLTLKDAPLGHVKRTPESHDDLSDSEASVERVSKRRRVKQHKSPAIKSMPVTRSKTQKVQQQQQQQHVDKRSRSETKAATKNQKSPALVPASAVVRGVVMAQRSSDTLAKFQLVTKRLLEKHMQTAADRQTKPDPAADHSGDNNHNSHNQNNSSGSNSHNNSNANSNGGHLQARQVNLPLKPKRTRASAGVVAKAKAAGKTDKSPATAGFVMSYPYSSFGFSPIYFPQLAPSCTGFPLIANQAWSGPNPSFMI